MDLETDASNVAFFSPHGGFIQLNVYWNRAEQVDLMVGLWLNVEFQMGFPLWEKLILMMANKDAILNIILS